MIRSTRLEIAVSVALLLISCAAPTSPDVKAIRPSDVPVSSTAPMSTQFFQPTDTPEFTPVPSPAPTHSPTTQPTPTPIPTPQMCSPLKNISLKELPEILTNPFQKPLPGHDDGHHGIDLAFYRRGSMVGIQGLSIQSVFSGIVGGIINNQQPYGNMVIVETPLDTFPPQWLYKLSLPQLQPTVKPAQGMICPTNSELAALPVDRQSLYLLYAHMNKPASSKIGEIIECGQSIGEVGTSGWSVNPHLHLESRIGPSGARFDKMTHYAGSATDLEMANYCAWRISGLFQLIDPLILLTIPQ